MATPLYFSNVSVVAHGPLRASVTAQIKYDKSTINVTVSANYPSTVERLHLPKISLDAVPGVLCYRLPPLGAHSTSSDR